MRSIFIFLLVFAGLRLLAQPDYSSMNMSSLTMEDGLLHNYVNVVYQDREGFIWIGTKEGLNRFDGLNFIEFSNNSEDSLSISSNVITSILEDAAGELWIGTTRGLNRLKLDGRGFIRYGGILSDASEFGSNNISVLFEDKDHELWVGTGDGNLHLYHRAEDNFQHFTVEGKSELREITEGPDNTLILGYGAWVLQEGMGGILHFDKNDQRFYDPASTPSNSNLSVTNIVQKEESNYWVSTYNSGLFQYNAETNELQDHQIESNDPSLQIPDILFAISMDEQGVLWINTDGSGILLYENSTGRLTSLSKANPIKGASNLAITTTFEDKNGIFWVGTVNNGVIVFNKYKSRFLHMTIEEGSKNGLSGESVLALEQSHEGGIWVGFDHGGVNYVDIDAQYFEHFLHDSRVDNTVSDDVINGLFETESGNLFIGTYLEGFDILNSGRNKFTHFGGPTAIKEATYVKCFYEDRSGNIWIGSRRQGLIRFDQKNNRAVNYKHDPDNPASLNNNHVSAILEENEHSLWIGTFNGLNQVDIERGSIRSWKHKEGDPKSLSGIQVYALCKDLQGGLWVGTDNGLNYYDRLNDDFRHFTTTTHGLASNTIKGILADDDNNLWISTNRGISRLSISTMEIRNYGDEDGLQGLGFNENAALKASDGRMYFGSTNGISFFHPQEITSNPIIPEVVITNLLVSNRPVEIGENSILQKPVSETKSITLPPQHSVFAFEFVALNYTSSKKNQYAYMLEGFDQEWTYVRTNQQATYTNISAGRYTFRVKASNNDGVWNEMGTSLEVVVQPVWWKTWWAYSAYFLTFLLAGFGVRNSAITRIRLLNDLKLERLAKEKEQEVNQIKIRFFTNLSHEFRTPLTLILGPLDKILTSDAGDRNIRKQLKLMQRNARRLFRLINQLMDFRKVDQGQMEFQAGEADIISFTKKVVGNFKLLAAEKGIRLSFNTSLTYQNVWIDKEMIDKVLYNLLSNAFNFTKKGDSISVSIEFATSLNSNGELVDKNNREYIAITVSDTGKGITKENQKLIFKRFYQAEHYDFGTGIGLSLAESLIELHQGDISVSSQIGEGSDFIVRLPLGNKHLDESELLIHTPESVQISQNYLSPKPETDELQTEQSEIQSNKECSLLIVEDNSELRFFLKESLIDTYNIFEATNGVEALDTALNNPIDLVISDVMMPEMNGIEFCNKLKSNLKISHIPVVLLTAKSGDDSAAEGLQTGADDYITKPFSFNLLQARIKNLIESRQQLKEQFRGQVDTDTHVIASTDIDQDFLMQVVQITEDNMADSDFNIDEILKEVGMSRSNFFRKIKSLTGQSPVDFISTIRFKTAAKLLLNSENNVTDVAFKIGYASTKNFRNGFKKHFQVTPTEYIKMSHQD